jgi:hypothetical protein
MEKLTPTTPPKVRDQREQEATVHIDSIVQEAKEVEELYEKTSQMWTSMEEDEKIQQLDQKQENITADIQELKQQQKEMAILERMRECTGYEEPAGRVEGCTGRQASKTGSLEPLQ